MNVVRANTQSAVTVLTEQELCAVKTIKKLIKGTIKMKQLDAINMRIASKPIMEWLKEEDLIYQGEDCELHVIEHKNSTTNGADQS